MEKLRPLARKRNIGIVAHIDAGKTTVTERVLYYTGKSHKMGEVHEGTATMDWMEEEKRRGITITAAATTCYWRDYEINIIDTPGHVDFTAEVERSLRVLDGVVTVFCGVAGVEAQSETVWRQAQRYHVPRICFINKLDRTGADFERAVASVRARLSDQAVPLTIPIGVEERFEGVIDIVRRKELFFDEEDLGARVIEREISEAHRDVAEVARQELIEMLADHSESVCGKFLADEELTVQDLVQGIREATLTGKFFPVLCGSALKYKGVQLLLDAICDYLPSPADVPPVEGVRPKTEEKVVRKATNPKSPLCAYAFKIAFDRHGDLIYLRVYSGVLKVNRRFQNATRDRKERVNGMWRMHAEARTALKEAHAGDIVAVTGLKFTVTGDTLCDEGEDVVLGEIEFPDTVISMAIEPKTNADKDKLMNALSKLTKEDPTFDYRVNEDTNQLVISGMGELHLEILKHRMLKDFSVDANVGEPRVAYRETVTAKGRGEAKYAQEIGGRGHYAHVVLTIEPLGLEKGREVVFENAVDESVIPKRFIPIIEEGVRSSVTAGVIAGFPMISLKVTLVDGSFHETDSSEMAFSVAPDRALRSAAEGAAPIILEPVMEVDATVPEEFVGGIIKDLNARRAEITNLGTLSKLKTVQGKVPLSEMFGYATVIRSLSQGRANYSLSPLTYTEIPKQRYKVFTQ